MRRNEDIVKLFLNEPRIDHIAINNNGDTCLHESAMFGRVDIAKLFLNEPRIDHIAINNNGDSCLHMAAMGGNKDITAHTQPRKSFPSCPPSEISKNSNICETFDAYIRLVQIHLLLENPIFSSIFTKRYS
jgi:ankyrin repeat protein